MLAAVMIGSLFAANLHAAVFSFGKVYRGTTANTAASDEPASVTIGTPNVAADGGVGNFTFTSYNPANITFSGNDVGGVLNLGTLGTFKGTISRQTKTGSTTDSFYFYESVENAGPPTTLSQTPVIGGRSYLLIVPGRQAQTANNTTQGLSSDPIAGDLNAVVAAIGVAPVITGPSGGAGAATSAKTINENTTPVYTFTANTTVTWSLIGGADVLKFSVNSATGALSFSSAPDYETPTDTGDTVGNNTYVVVIQAATSGGNTSSQTVTVTVANIPATTISVTAGTYTYDGNPQGPVLANVTTTSDQTPTLSYSGSGGTTYGPSATRPTAVGTYAITATVAAHSTGNPEGSATAVVGFSIDDGSKLASTISISGGTYTYNGSAQGPGLAQVTKTGSTGVVTYSYSGTGSTSYGPSSTPPTNVGTYSVTATLAGDANYNGATSAATAFTISNAASTISISGGSYTYNGSEQGPALAQVTKTGSTGSVTYSYAGTGSTTYGPSATPPVDAGTYTVTATLAADATYSGATSSATAFTISKAASTISIATAPYTYSGSAQGPGAAQVTETGSSGAVTYVYVGTGSTSYGPSSTPPTGAGTYTVTATVAADANYNGATSAATSFTISQRPLTVTAAAKSKTLGATDPALTYTLTAGSLVAPDVISGALTRASGETAGTYAINQGTLSAGSNYAITYVSANLTIGKATPTITWSNPAPIIAGTPLSSVQLNAVGSVPGTLVYSPALGALLEPGTYTLRVTLTPTDTVNYNGPVTALVTLVVQLPAAPSASDDSARALEASGTANATPGTDATGNALTNDTGTGITVTNCGGVAFTDKTTLAGKYGTLVITSDGGFTYAVNQTLPAVEALNKGDTLTEAFDYTVTDRYGRTATAKITLTIDGANDAPVAVAVSPQKAVLGKPFGPVVFAPFTDVDNATLTYTLSGLPPGLVFDPITRTLSGVPTAFGSFEITLVGSDGALSASSKFTFNVYAPPVNSLPAVPLVIGAEPVRMVASDGSKFSVADQDSPILTVNLTSGHGVLTLPTRTGLTLLEGTGANDLTVTVKGPVSLINLALAELIYQAQTGFFGTDAITITSTDEQDNQDIDRMDPPLTIKLVTLGGNTAVASIVSLADPAKALVSAEVTKFDASVVSGAQITGSGAGSGLAVGTPTRQDGSVQQTVVKVKLTYADGTSETTDIQVTIYNPKLSLVTQLVLNPQTSLYEQSVQVTNTTPYVIDSFRIVIPTLPAGVSLYSRTTTTTDGRQVIDDTRPMTAGESRTFVIEYFAPSVQRFTEPALTLQINGAAAPATPIGVNGTVDRVVIGAGSRTYVEFATTTDRTYWVQYRDSATAAWQTSPMSVNGTGTTIHWLDAGWPMTLSAPTATREYRTLYTNGIASTLAVSTQPVSAQVAPGAASSLKIAVSGGTNLTYQWYRDGVAIPGATSDVYTIAKAGIADEGNYYAVASDGRTSIQSAVSSFSLASANPGRIVNLSVRAKLDAGTAPLITGFVMQGAGSKPILVRGVGETLTNFGLTGAAKDTAIQLYRGSSLIGENDNWSLDASAETTRTASANAGAFALLEGGSDSAMVRRLLAESYTLHTFNRGATAGVALVEVYDVLGKYDGSNWISNVSARAKISQGDGVLIAGMVIGGDTTCRVLVRAVGPTLANFGVTGALDDPTVALYPTGSATPVATNDDWASVEPVVAKEGLFTRAGAFALPSGSKDAVLVTRVTPGAYTLVVSGKGAAQGQALIEIYLIK